MIVDYSAVVKAEVEVRFEIAVADFGPGLGETLRSRSDGPSDGQEKRNDNNSGSRHV